MPERIPASVALRVPFFAVLASDDVSPATGKTIAITISKNGAAFGNPSGGATNATEIASGWYYVDLSTTDTGTAGPLVVRGTQADINDVGVAYNVVAATNGGFSALPAVAAEAVGGLYTRGTGAGQINQPANGQIDVNVERWNTTSVPAENTAGYPIVTVKSGTGTGEVNLASGKVEITEVQIDQIVDEVWDELEADHTDSGSMAAAITECLEQITLAVSNTMNISTFDPDVDLVDTITFTSAMEAILAVVAGQATVVGSTISFKKRDGGTEKVSITVGTPGQRTASTIS